MRFLNDSDYTALIRNEIKGALVGQYTDSKLHAAEKMAIAQIKQYISGKHPVEQVFVSYDPDTDTEDNRDAFIIMITIDLTLYHLYTSTAPNLIPKHRNERYADALEWLKGVAKGSIESDLPKHKDSAGTDMLNIKIRSRHESENQKW